MHTKQAYFDALNHLLAAMPPGQIDIRQIETNEQHYGHRFFDPPETVHQWLLDQQRRVQAAWPPRYRQREATNRIQLRSGAPAEADAMRAGANGVIRPRGAEHE